MNTTMLTAAMLLLSLKGFTQSNDTLRASQVADMQKRMVLAGKELRKYQGKHTSGIIMTIAGGGVAAAGAASGSGGVAIVGGAISLVGFVVAQFSAPGHITKAGNALIYEIPLKQ